MSRGQDSRNGGRKMKGSVNGGNGDNANSCQAKVVYEPYVGLQEVASFLGVSIASLRKWREKGEMPFRVYGIGRRLSFRLSEVDDWAQSRLHTNPAELKEMAI